MLYPLGMNFDRLDDKKKALIGHFPLPKSVLTRLQDWFRIQVLLHCCGLAASGVTQDHVVTILFHNRVVPILSFKHHLEVSNAHQALLFVDKVGADVMPFKSSDLVELNRLLYSGLSFKAGECRSISTGLSGDLKVQNRMVKVSQSLHDVFKWLNTPTSQHAVFQAVELLYRLLTIRPFYEGNKRTAFLFMNAILVRSGFPLVWISHERYVEFMEAIQSAQIKHDFSRFYTTVYDAIDESLSLYLDVAQAGEHHPIIAAFDSVESSSLSNPVAPFANLTPISTTDDGQPLLRIGQVAKQSGETTPTIRFWTKEGLLTVSQISPGGYQLFHPAMVQRARDIRRLQSESRLSIAEIRKIASAA